jgi:hypothetical protein
MKNRLQQEQTAPSHATAAWNGPVASVATQTMVMVVVEASMGLN